MWHRKTKGVLGIPLWVLPRGLNQALRENMVQGTCSMVFGVLLNDGFYESIVVLRSGTGHLGPAREGDCTSSTCITTCLTIIVRV